MFGSFLQFRIKKTNPRVGCYLFFSNDNVYNFSTMGVSRSSVIGDGVNTVSLIQAVNASQREDFDNTDDPIWYVSGKHVQPNWSKGDMPPGVSREWVDKQAIFMTPGGVATGESNLQVLRYIFVRHRKRLVAIGYDGEIILGIDCPASRCIKWLKDGTFEVPPFGVTNVMLSAISPALTAQSNKSPTPADVIDQAFRWESAHCSSPAGFKMLSFFS